MVDANSLDRHVLTVQSDGAFIGTPVIDRGRVTLNIRQQIGLAAMLCPFASLLPDRAIVLVDWYTHGEFGRGVLWAAFEDSAGSRAHVCIDNRVDSSTRGRVFDGARHPRQPDATPIELGNEIEGHVVALLSNWCDDPANWNSHGGPYWDDFKEIFIKTVLCIGSHS